MPDVTVERLTLRICGVSADEAAEIGRHVAEGLGRAAAVPATRARVDRVGVRVRSGSSADPRGLADRAITEIVRELGRAI